MMVKCACGNPDCKTKICFDTASSILLFTDKTDHDTVMYMDPNTIREMVKGLREMLNQMVFGEKGKD